MHYIKSMFAATLFLHRVKEAIETFIASGAYCSTVNLGVVFESFQQGSYALHIVVAVRHVGDKPDQHHVIDDLLLHKQLRCLDSKKTCNGTSSAHKTLRVREVVGIGSFVCIDEYEVKWWFWRHFIESFRRWADYDFDFRSQSRNGDILARNLS